MRELVSQERLRSDSCRFLSACFCQPQKDLFLEENMLQNLTLSLAPVCPEAAEHAAAMEKNIHHYSNVGLTVEYAKLFVGPFATLAPPYGSIYLDGERKVMGDSTMEVIRQYEEAGLSGKRDFHDLPDHIAVELEFMSYLIYAETAAIKKMDITSALAMIDRQEKFLDSSLRRWITPFCIKITEQTDNMFYTSLANCTAKFLAHDCTEAVRAALNQRIASVSQAY